MDTVIVQEMCWPKRLLFVAQTSSKPNV